MNFDPVARSYRWIEYAAFGRALERRRFAFLDRLSEARNILILGEGDGRCLKRLLTAAPHASFDVVDSSASMIALAQERIGDGASRVHFHLADASRISRWPSRSYDGLVTHFFLDCFTEAEARGVIRCIAAALEPGGIWLVSEFSIPPRGWRRVHAQVWIWAMYTFFRLATRLPARSLPPVDELLTEAGMQRVERQEERFGLMGSSVWEKKLY